MIKGKLLKRTELNKVIDRIRLMPKETKNMIAPLVLHERALWEMCKRLEEELARMQNPKLVFVPNRGTPLEDPDTRGSKWERLKMCVEEDKWEQPGFGAMLQRLRLSKEQALGVYQRWKETGVVPEL